MPGRSVDIEPIKTVDSERWKETLDEIGPYDFYHLPSFHRLAEIRGEGEAVMPVVCVDGYKAAFPLLVRDVEFPPGSLTSLKDATCVYGFTGPVLPTRPVPDAARQKMLAALQEYLTQHGIISVFSRLNPLFDQPQFLCGFGELVERGVTVSLDLAPLEDMQVSRYIAGVRGDLKKLKRLGFVCEEAGPERLDDFIRIYSETMERVNAEPLYRFDRPYFEYLMREMSDIMHLFICSIDGLAVGASIHAACGEIAEYHLAGTTNDYVMMSPSKLLLDTERRWSSERGMRTFHLGGGGGAGRDSLYQFKMSFGGREHPYYTWRFVADPKVYRELSQEACRLAGVDLNGSYFPVYRHPLLGLKGSGG